MPNLRLSAGFFFLVFTTFAHASDVTSVVGDRVVDIDTVESLPLGKVRADDTTYEATLNQESSIKVLDAGVGSFFSTLRVRLQLTEQQAHEVEPVVRSHVNNHLNVLRENGISPDSRSAGEKIDFRQLRAIKREMDSLDKQIESELVEILNDEQIEEYRLIQEEWRAEIRSQIRSRVGR